LGVVRVPIRKCWLATVRFTNSGLGGLAFGLSTRASGVGDTFSLCAGSVGGGWVAGWLLRVSWLAVCCHLWCVRSVVMSEG
jgi:hypothetical protein